MINDFYEYFLTVGINVLDFGMLYYLTHNIVIPRNRWLNAKESTKMPKLTLKVIVFGILYGIIIGYFGYLFTDEILFRVIGIVLIWVIITYMIKDKLKNAVIIHAIMLLTFGVMQTIILFSLEWINIPLIYVTLINQLLCFFTVVIFYKKVSLHKLFVFIKNRLSGINFLLLLSFTVLFSTGHFLLFFHSFDVNSISLYREYALIIIGLISIISVVVSYQFIIHTQKLNSIFHHIENVFEGLDYLLKSETDLKKIRKQYAGTLKRIEFDMPESSFTPNHHVENIGEFIENKKISQKAKMEIVKNIEFYWENRVVEIPMIIHMLGTLLNNAFETKTKKPLFVDVRVAAHELEITVSNASDNKSFVEVAQMFDAGASTKKGNHGYGLLNLSKMVKSYDGDISVSCDYKTEYKSHYLTMTIQIKEFK